MICFWHFFRSKKENQTGLILNDFLYGYFSISEKSMAMLTYVTDTFIHPLTGRTKAQWLEMGV